MIFSRLSELEIHGITEILEKYGQSYEVRISDHVEEQNAQDKKDWLAAYHVKVASTDLLEIEFDPKPLLEVVSKDDQETLLGLRIVLDQDNVLSEQELSEQIANSHPRKPGFFEKIIEGRLSRIYGIVALLVGLFFVLKRLQSWLQ